jgi:hypothetical protein
MHDHILYKQVITLKRNGLSITQIHDITNLPLSTIKDWIYKKTRISQSFFEDSLSFLNYLADGKDRKTIYDFYSFLLGFYFANGNIYKHNNTYKLCFYINAEHFKQFNNFFKYIFNKNFKLCPKTKKLLSVYNKNYILLFPKNKQITWQESILDIHYLFMGLLKNHTIKNNEIIFKHDNEIIQLFKGCCYQLQIPFIHQNNSIIIKYKENIKKLSKYL